MKKTLGYLAFLAFIGIFLAGYQFGVLRAEEKNRSLNKYISVFNAIGAYSIQASIYEALVSGNTSKAICLVQLQTNVDINTVRKCMEDKYCRPLMESEIQKTAPELLGQGESRIGPYKEIGYCK
jgi:hypothetical protein